MGSLRLRDLPTFVVSGPRHEDRRERLGSELAGCGLTPRWVMDPDAEALDRKTVRAYYRPNRLRWRRRVRATVPIPFRRLTRPEIAVTIAHVEILREIAEGDAEWAFVLEDDAIFAPEFSVTFDAVFADVPDDADLVYIGSCCNLRIPDPVEGVHFYRKARPSTKCSDSTIVSRRAARAITRTIVPFALAFDWEMNYHVHLHDLTVYWLEPPLVAQGSQTGVFKSSLR